LEHAVYSQGKVLLVTNDLGPRAGGIETFILGLIEGLPKDSLIVYTSTQPGDKEFDQQLLAKFGVVVIRDRAKVLLPTPRINRKAASILKEHQITRVWFGAAAPLALMASKLRAAGAKHIVALTHGHELWWAKVFVLRSLIKKIVKDVDYLGYLGNYTQSVLINTGDKNKFVQIAPGIDTNYFSPRAKNQELVLKHRLDGRRVIVCVGRLVHRKGQDQLIKAMPEVLRQFPDAVLLFVGDGPIKSMLENSARQLGVSNHIIFAGKISHTDLTDYICLGEIFAMPVRSRFFGLEVEGLGIVYLEASACGLPVIAGNSGGAPDAVLPDITGLVIDGTSTSQTADAICRLLEDPIGAKQMGQAGRGWVIENWKNSHWSNKFNELLFRD
jgi:phosphatidylinositol alpha-1,6-mannosyltransferase